MFPRAPAPHFTQFSGFNKETDRRIIRSRHLSWSYGKYLPLNVPVTLAFKGKDYHATSENFIPGTTRSLSLATGNGYKAYDPERTSPLPVAHPGMDHALIAWGDHETRLFRRERLAAARAARERRAP